MLLQCSVTHPTFLTPFLFCHNGVLAIRHTNDCVSKPVISGTLTLCATRGLYRYLWIVRFLEISVTVQLHRYTHEIITTYRYGYVFSVVGCIFIVLTFYNMLHCNFNGIWTNQEVVIKFLCFATASRISAWRLVGGRVKKVGCYKTEYHKQKTDVRARCFHVCFDYAVLSAAGTISHSRRFTIL